MARTFVSTDRVVTSAFAIPSAMTVCWWEKAPTAFNMMLSFASGRLNTYYRSDTVSIHLIRSFTGGDQWTRTPVSIAITAGNWNHLAWTQDGTVADYGTCYVNATAITGTVLDIGGSGSIVTTSSAFGMGNKTDGSSPSGTAAWVSLHNVVLTQTEIQEAMTMGKTSRGLIGAWELGGASPEPDSSGNGRDGTVTGSTVVAGPPGVPAVTTPVDVFAIAVNL